MFFGLTNDTIGLIAVAAFNGVTAIAAWKAHHNNVDRINDVQDTVDDNQETTLAAVNDVKMQHNAGLKNLAMTVDRNSSDFDRRLTALAPTPTDPIKPGNTVKSSAGSAKVGSKAKGVGAKVSETARRPYTRKTPKSGW